MRWFVLVGLVGCKVVDAPDNLEQLMVYGFVNYDESDRFLEATEEQLLALVATQEEELAKGYRINNLSEADLAAAGVEGKDITGILGFMGVADYVHELDAVLEATCATDKDARWPDKFLTYDIQETTDRECFLAGECDRLDQNVHEVANVALLGDADRTFDASYRWVGGEELPRAVFVRQLTPDGIEFSTGIAQTYQQYSLAMVYEHDGHARRLEAFWVDFTILGAGVPDEIAISTAINEMNKQVENIDTWIDENG